jgi:hypothetical protein
MRTTKNPPERALCLASEKRTLAARIPKCAVTLDSPSFTLVSDPPTAGRTVDRAISLRLFEASPAAKAVFVCAVDHRIPYRSITTRRSLVDPRIDYKP